MATALDRILEYKREEVRALKRRNSLEALSRAARDTAPVRPFADRLDAVAATGGNALICEIKRRSPSAGDILPGADPAGIAADYFEGGAACLSVLTDGPSFGGSIADFQMIRQAVSLPMLRKDFMIDPVQILESRAIGADCILLIMSALDDAQATELFIVAERTGLDILVEVHDEDELDRAMTLPGGTLGINNRDLRQMRTDVSVTERLLSRIPDNRNVVSESGINGADTVARLRKSGIQRFLVGEWLMKQGKARAAQTQLLVQAGAVDPKREHI